VLNHCLDEHLYVKQIMGPPLDFCMRWNRPRIIPDPIYVGSYSRRKCLGMRSDGSIISMLGKFGDGWMSLRHRYDKKSK